VKGFCVELGGVDVVEDDLGVEALGVLLEARHQVGALHAVGVGRPVVHVGGGHQLAALGQAGDQQRLQVGAGGVDGGGVAGGPEPRMMRREWRVALVMTGSLGKGRKSEIILEAGGENEAGASRHGKDL
jgi:hypothetical protein